MCVFRFPHEGGEAYVDSVHPGHTLAEVREATAWEVKVDAHVHETPPPTEAELREIRIRAESGAR
jgi:acyl CoA:acetate/3-ketoacid CoA transferase beta subunit